ncbi:hypothetical protein A1O1_00154 [Capronia coronata CBS 617.96]|uniref:Uncharacterized protein n=1 Tax=Capronia coronata CBS 617.96 TaxID=1182541 RepID=W9Z0E6_9EURO|nr:uncharacterized protein A1O1_00154 [Capronia coronata CBS 617.96]EXJ95036.1 hypothetical protein A1O1_00154 [Capronia coronata CBS 617.96]
MNEKQAFVDEDTSHASEGEVMRPLLSPSTRHYTFTPQRTQAPPRAWERRPATPYVPRTEAQKIWKRVPLGAIDLSDGHSWRKVPQPADRRSVKRLRVAQTNGEDKENEDYVTSKWDEDGMVANSPKRKLFGYDGATQGETTSDESDEPSTRISRDSNGRSDKDDNVINEQTERDPAIATSVEDVDVSISIPAVQISNGDNGTSSQEARDPLVPEPVSSECVDSVNSSASSLPEATPSDHNLSTFKSNAQPCSPQAETEPQRLSHEGSDVPRLGEVVNFPIDHDDFPFLQNFLSQRQARKAAKMETAQEDAQQPVGPEEVADQITQEPATAPPQGMEQPVNGAMGDMNTTLSGHVNSDPTTGHDQSVALEPDQGVDANISSPCRRSSRLNTKLAGPKRPVATLPSNISLKRLNGNEFIATQREGQSLAIVTRSNTKRNKGPAVSVKVKLIQLRAEAEARGLNATAATPIGNYGADGTKKAATRVKWDGILARFEDGSVVENMPDVEAPCEAAKETGCDSGDVAAEDQPPHEPRKAEDEAQAQEKPARKVRKLRKLNAGTVNGTPAPKRTTSIPVPARASSAEKPSDVSINGKGPRTSEAKAVGCERRAQSRPQRRLGTCA